MKISLTYNTEVTVLVDLASSSIESITVRKEIGSPLTGVHGAVHICPVRQPTEDEPFTRDHERRAISIIKSTKHPKWTLKEPR